MTGYDPWNEYDRRRKADDFFDQDVVDNGPNDGGPDTPPTVETHPWNDFPIGDVTQDGANNGGEGGGGDEGFGGGGPARPPFAPNYVIPNAPNFNAPKFTAPDPNGIFSDPSFQFRLKNGLGAMQNAAAAKGLLRTGMTFKDLNDYGQNSASQEYSGIFNRALQGFDRDYQGAKDEFAPKYGTWEHQVDWGTQSAKLALANMWADYFRNTIPAETLFTAGLGE